MEFETKNPKEFSSQYLTGEVWIHWHLNAWFKCLQGHLGTGISLVNLSFKHFEIYRQTIFVIMNLESLIIMSSTNMLKLFEFLQLTWIKMLLLTLKETGLDPFSIAKTKRTLKNLVKIAKSQKCSCDIIQKTGVFKERNKIISWVYHVLYCLHTININTIWWSIRNHFLSQVRFTGFQFNLVLYNS